jgi:hypothetical protein
MNPRVLAAMAVLASGLVLAGCNATTTVDKETAFLVTAPSPPTPQPIQSPPPVFIPAPLPPAKSQPPFSPPGMFPPPVYVPFPPGPPGSNLMSTR